VLDSYRRNFPAGARHLFFTTNHDENSWNGTEYEKYGDAAALLAVFSHTWYGIPLIYTGQELPNTRRLKFFDKDPIEWSHTPVLHGFYKMLLELRAQHPALADAADTYPLWVHTNVDDQALVYRRQRAGQQVVVALNFTSNPLFVEFREEAVRGVYRDLFTGDSIPIGSSEMLEIKPFDYWVLVQ
jgi:glycosidase